MSGREILFNLPQGGFLLFLLIPILFGLFALIRYRQRQQQSYTSSSLLSRLLVPRSPALTYTKIAGWTLIWILACLALMSPYGNVHYSPSAVRSLPAITSAKPRYIPHEIIFLVDTSASMGVPDGPDGETRLTESQTIMEDIIQQLRGQTTSLYAFTSELSSLVPPTVDYLFMRLSIKDLHLDEGDVGGTRFAPILTSLKEQAFPAPSPKRYTVMMFTDGGDTKLESLQGEAREKEKQAILNAIPNPEQLHVRLFTVGVGSLQPQSIPQVTFDGKPVQSKLEPEILKELAERKRGKFYMAQDWTSWNLAQELVSQIGQEDILESAQGSQERQVTSVKKEDILVDLYYQVPLSLALLFYLLNMLMPDVRRL